jgi:hypothetical protein
LDTPLRKPVKPSSKSPSSTTPREPRPRLSHCCHRLLHRKLEIEAQLASIEARKHLAGRKRETRANIIIGAVARTHATLDPGFAGQLAAILDRAVRRPADRELLASVLNLTRLAGADVAAASDPAARRIPLPCPLPAAVAQTPDRAREVRLAGLRLRDHAVKITARR